MGIFAIHSGKDIALLIGMTLMVYVFFMFLGVGISSYATFSTCQKTNTSVHFQQGALWAIYPTVGYAVTRSIEAFRIYFDRFYRGFDGSVSGAERAGWVSIGYVMMLTAVAGMYGLMDTSITDVCVPSIDEATKFKQDMLKRQAAKAAAHESTPAVQLQTQ